VLPWFENAETPPLYLAPMAGVTDLVFRRLCKELGADVMVTEFVSAEGIIRRDDRTRCYTEFEDEQRPMGVQLFGADGDNMAEAAKKVIDWKQPDFIDINFGCPVKKIVSRNGGSSLLRDCPLLAEVAGKVAAAVDIPVTAKIRTGWDEQSVNAEEVVHVLEDCGMAAVAIHGRTRSQGYRGDANWEVIARCAEVASIPVIGNGDIDSGAAAQKRISETGVQALMIGRAAMSNPWIFSQIKNYIETGEEAESVSLEQRWELIHRHCRMAVEWGRYGNELQTMQAMRSRLMAYSRAGIAGGKSLRVEFTQVESLAELEDIAANHLERVASLGLVEPVA